MQPGWLKEYFKPEDLGGVEHTVDGCDGTSEGADVSRRDFVKSGFVAGVAAGMAAGGVAGAAKEAEVQTANPLSGQWWPSPWGPKDERGANNRITPAKVLEAARLIKNGKIYQLWKKDNAEYNKGCPGPGITAGRWLAGRKIAVVGADNWPVEAVPGENPDLVFGCHAIWLTVNGIYINENLDLEQLAADKVSEFAWSFNPLPLKGATGSPGNSVAIA